jgi:hypothetical protein
MTWAGDEGARGAVTAGMGLFDTARAALTASGATDLRIEQALEITAAYGEALERVNREPGAVADEADLPYPKDTIKWALLLLLGSLHEGALREPLKAGYVALAEWQDRERLAAEVFDSARLRRKLDPLALAKEFAARATAEDRCIAAARAEANALIAELRGRGFW